MNVLLLMPGIVFIWGIMVIIILKQYQLKKLLDFWSGDNKIKENEKLHFNANYAIITLSAFCCLYFCGTFIYQNSLDRINEKLTKQKSEEYINERAKQLVLILKKEAIDSIKSDIGKKIDELIYDNQ